MRFRKKKILCFLLSFALLFSLLSNSLVALAALYDYDETLLPVKYSFEGRLVIDQVNYVDASKTDSELASTITEIIIENGADIEVDSEKYNATLTVDGVECDIKPGTYIGSDIVITLTGKAEVMSGFPKFDRPPGSEPEFIYYYTRAAAVVADGALQEGYSVLEALIGGETDGQSSSEVTINSQGSFFNGYWIDNSTYEINNLNMTLNGYGGDDFQGWGAGIVATNGADVTLSDSYIDTTGVIRTAIWAGGEGSKLTAENVVVYAHPDKSATPYSNMDNFAAPMLERVPFVLGLEGNIRATNVLGSAEAAYNNSLIVSECWGALSTDSGRRGTNALTVTDTLAGIGTIEVAQSGVEYTATKEINGVTYGFNVYKVGEGSGYVTYSDQGVIDTFDNVEFYSPDYIGILAAGPSTMIFNDSYGFSDRIGFMSHQSENGVLTINGGSFDVADTFVMVKSGTPNKAIIDVSINGADINIFGDNPQSGVILQLMETDDAGGPGVTSYIIDDKTLDEIKEMTSGGDIAAATASFTDVELEGDIYNSIYTFDQPLDVTLENSAITGVISSSVATHVDENGEPMDGQTVTAGGDDYLAIGRIVNEACETVRNPVNLKLTNSTWKVTGTSYLASLELDADSEVVGAGYDMVIMTVDGVETPIEAGEKYIGEIVITTLSDYVVDHEGGSIHETVPTYTGYATSFKGRGEEDYSVGYYISGGSIVADKSLIPEADEQVSRLDIDLFVYGDEPFNTVLAKGEGTDITLTGKIEVRDDGDGSKASDFSARGAAITATDYATVRVEDMEIYTEGFVRAALISDEEADLFVKNSKITAMGANPLTEAYPGYKNSAIMQLMISPPWVLGIQGGARTANMLGKNSSLSVIGSDISSGGWGVLSTDSGSNFRMNVVDSTLSILPESEGGMSAGPFIYGDKYGSGYGTYIIGNAQEYFYGVNFEGMTYASILTGGDAYYQSSSGNILLEDPYGLDLETVEGKGNVTAINTVFGFMAHNNGSINVLDGTIVNTEEATFLYKAGNVDFVADEALLKPGSGIILQMIDNDDSTVGASMGAGGPVFNTVFHEDEGWPSENGNVTDPSNVPPGPGGGKNEVTLTLTNGDYEGDVYNGTGYYNQPGDSLSVTVGENAKLKGVISLTETRHIDENGEQNTYFTINEYYYLGHVENKLYNNGNSTLSVTLEDGAVWTVTGTNYLTKLYVESGSSINAPSGYSVAMTVDGVSTKLEAGKTYEGNIVLSLVKSSFGGYTDGTTVQSYKITAAAGTGGTITPSSAVVTRGGSATFTIKANEGYRISDVLVDGASVGAVASYTFSNVTGAHTIEARFSTEEEEEPVWINPFVDVDEDDWFYESVAFVVQRGLFKGISADEFNPKGEMTRAMLVTVLYRLSGEIGGGESSFDDVPSGVWYSDAVAWAADSGIVSGVGNNKFDPNGSITREQAAVMLYNMAVYLGLDVSESGSLAGFSDSLDLSGWAEEAMKWAVGAGLFEGSDGKLNPGGNATRAELAKLLMYFISEVIE
ncbi:MAG: S-layer homology domain-containing protein [Oscillospiraceae bacterium]|jgi:hypothetical protein